ncbi:hypothetical protein HYV86_05805 [Candidatus Woesearchaeota archaeon]|nr:hypothetical protein [Candidatus Woesearchaeota archaeon]
MFDQIVHLPEFRNRWNVYNTAVPWRREKKVHGEFIGTKCTYHAADNSYFKAAISVCLEQIGSSGSFLDLGSGDASFNIEVGALGWQSYGIEICDAAYEVGCRNLTIAEKRGDVKVGLVHLARGNFFPKDFPVTRAEGEEDRFRQPIEEHLCRSYESDPYHNLGLDLGDVDVFHHYQVERNQNMLDFFSRYAHRGAYFFLTQSAGDSYVVPADVKELSRLAETLFLYQKT